jgi:HK97 family phage prohead protease
VPEPTGPRREGVETRAASVVDVDFSERIIEVIAVPYDQETVVSYRGEMMRESVAPGAFAGIEGRGDHVTANREHNYERSFGKVVGYREDPRGLVAQIRASETPLGDETLRLAADGVLKASVGMVVRRSDQIIRGGLRRIKRAFLDHLAMVPNPAYAGADVLAVRQEQQEPEQPAPSTPNLDGFLQDPVIAAALEGRR